LPHRHLPWPAPAEPSRGLADPTLPAPPSGRAPRSGPANPPRPGRLSPR